MRVDPENRLVVDSLEAHWNEKPRALGDVHEEYTRRREQDTRLLTDEQRSAIPALPRTSRTCGAIPVRPIAIASAWSDCCWRT